MTAGGCSLVAATVALAVLPVVGAAQGNTTETSSIGPRAVAEPGLTSGTPLSLVVLLDVSSTVSRAMTGFVWDGQGRSGSLRPTGFNPPDSLSDLFLRPLLDGVVKSLRADDRVVFGRITHEPEFLLPMTSDATAAARGARWAVDVSPNVRYGATPLWDAVDAAVDLLNDDGSRRRAILLITDGLSTGNRTSLSAVINKSAQADVAVAVIGEAWGRPRSARGWWLSDNTDAPWFMVKGAFTSPFALLNRLATETGGVFLPDGDDGRKPDPGAKIAEAIRVLQSSQELTLRAPAPKP